MEPADDKNGSEMGSQSLAQLENAHAQPFALRTKRGASPKISREKKMVARNSEDRVSRASKLDLV